MTTATKAINYTADNEATIMSAAAASASGMLSKLDIPALSEKLGKSVKSLTAKVSRMGLYSKVESTYKAKDGSEPIKKSGLVDALQTMLAGTQWALSENDAQSLEKVTKKALACLVGALANSKPV